MNLRVRLVVQDLARKGGLWVPGPETVLAENSWLKALAQLHAGLMALTNQTIKDTSGADQTFAYARMYIMRAAWPAGGDIYGIQVGTGTTPVSADDYQLAGQVAHGTGPGELYYQACTVTGPTAISGGYREAIARQFDNGSEDAVTVQEVGVSVLFSDTAAASHAALVLRDLTGAVEIAAAASKLFTYQVDFLA